MRPIRNAKTQLALIYLSGSHGLRDSVQAEGLLLDAAEAGNPDASLHLGHLYSGQIDPALARPGDAAKFYQIAAEAGSAVAQHQLAALLSGENASPARLAEAANWFRRAAENGLAPSQFQMGVLLCTGRGVEADLAEATRWYERAAEAGHKLAMYNLGVMLLKGMGVEPDPARGEALIRQSEIKA